MNMRKYPVGIQSFESIRKDGYIYVDKTPFIYKMITEGKPYFLSRPRRFGKSLLVSTLAAVFEGRQELFEAFTTEDGIEQPQLFIATTKWKWEKYPVLRFDFSAGDLSNIEQLDTLIDAMLDRYEQQYGINDEHGDTCGDARAPIHQSRNTAHAAAHEVVRDEEGGPTQAHGTQRQGNDDISFHLGQYGFLVCFHNGYVLLWQK